MKKKTTKTRIAGRANQSVRPALPQRAEKRNVARRSGARYVRAGRLSTTQTDTPINTHAYTPSTHANSRQSPTYLDDESETDANIPRDTWDVLWERLEESDEFSTAYIYRLDANDEPQKPFLLRCGAWPGLPDMLRDEHGGGGFLIMIRRKRKMVFTGKVWIGAAPVKGGQPGG